MPIKKRLFNRIYSKQPSQQDHPHSQSQKSGIRPLILPHFSPNPPAHMLMIALNCVARG
jgi:hypothetical protein